MDRKLCVTCKWHRTGTYPEAAYAKCAQPELVSANADPVHGELPFCMDMRYSAGPDRCGDGEKHEMEEVGHA